MMFLLDETNQMTSKMIQMFQNVALYVLVNICLLTEWSKCLHTQGQAVQVECLTRMTETYDPSKRRELFTNHAFVTSHKTQLFSSLATKNCKIQVWKQTNWRP
jgi:hypothetical protein